MLTADLKQTTSPKNETGIGKSKLDILREREGDLRAQIAAEVKRRQKRQLREFTRLRAIVGGAVVAIAERDPDFKATVGQSLRAADIAPNDRAFLKSKGWQ
jgi:hypothetical protein